MSGATLASWWGYAEADPTLVAILVGAVAVLAVSYVVVRVTRQRRDAAALTGDKTSRR